MKNLIFLFYSLFLVSSPAFATGGPAVVFFFGIIVLILVGFLALIVYLAFKVPSKKFFKILSASSLIWVIIWWWVLIGHGPGLALHWDLFMQFGLGPVGLSFGAVAVAKLIRMISSKLRDAGFVGSKLKQNNDKKAE
jgi:hypothetical protein